MAQPKDQSNKARKRRLLKRVRRQRLEFITILPSLITLINGICGFAAIGFASKGPSTFAMAGYMIFFAMIADMLDGRVARMSQTTSSFGGQLDSMCDMISFGVAPAFLMLKVLEHKLTALIAPTTLVVSGFLTRFIWLTAAVYVACAAIRLARFNVENEEDETSHMSFMGLPTPAAAGVLASMVVFYEEMLVAVGPKTWMFQIGEGMIMYSLPFIAVGVAVLMISRIRYPHIVNQHLKGRKPFAHLVWLGGTIGLIYLCGLPSALLIVFCGFALIGFGKWFYYRIIVSRTAKAREIEPPVLSLANSSDQQDA